VDKTPWEVSRDGDLMLAAHRAAYERYRHTPVVVGVDIYNLEAEAYGCTVARPDGHGIPAITQPICTVPQEMPGLPALDAGSSGRIPMVIETAARLQRAFPDADIRVPLSGPFSIAASVLGLDALLAAVLLEPAPLRDALEWLADGQVALARAVRDSGLDVAFFESAAAPPLLSPIQFREVELPPLKRAIRGVGKVMGHAVPCIIGGDTSPIVDDMMETGTRFVICPSETDRRAFLEKMTSYPDVRVRVNLSPGVYSRGTHDQVRTEIDSVLTLAGEREELLLGTGAIPYETPIENILFLLEVTEELNKRRRR
jgi:uroporphyrinogen decarboxylase